jgi:NTE family protein
MMKYLFTILLGFLMDIGQAQQRPQLGLVLSGGGAKGFAHAGVLEILDSIGFPVDMVAGTSMGAIVGGLYAIGYRPLNIQQAFLEADWSEIISTEPQRLHRPFHLRSAEDRYLLRMGLSGFQPTIPGGIISGHKVFATLSFYTQGFHEETNFLEFPRKFLCVAADLNTGFEQIFTSGSLPDVMRASMAIPSVFQPHRYRNKWLIDGGVVNNFPANHLAELGANIIIGVDVQTTFADTITRPTLASILEKTSMYKNYETTRERELLCDLIIRPDMTHFGVSDFELATAIIESGRRAARQALPQLLELMRKTGVVDPELLPAYEPLPEKITLGKVMMFGLKNVPKTTVLGILDVRDSSEVSISQLEENLKFLYGTGYFEQVSYHPIRRGDLYDLEIRAVESDLDGSANFGLRYDRDFGFAILINYTRNNLFFSGGQLSADLVLGQMPRYHVDYHFNTGTIPGLGIGSRGILSTYNFFADKVSQGTANHDDNLTRLYWQATVRSEYLIGGYLGYHFSWQNFSRLPALRMVEPNPDNLRLRHSHLLVGGYFRSDQLDHSYFPTKGTLNEGDVRFVDPLNYGDGLEASRPFLNMTWRTVHAKTLAHNWVGIAHFAGSLIWFEDATIPYKVFMGGLGQHYFNNQLAFAGFQYRELGTLAPPTVPEDVFRNSGMVAGFDLRHTLRKNLFLTALVQVGGTANRPSGFVRLPEWYLGYGFKMGYMTLAGPIEVAIHRNAAMGGRTLLFFNYGYWF